MNRPQLTEIWLYPVKSFAGIQVERWRLDTFGLHLDRRWMVVDKAGRFLTQREYPQMARITPALEVEGESLSLTLQHPRLGVFKVPPPEQGASRVRVEVWSDVVEAVPVGQEADRWVSDALGACARLVWFPDEVMRQVDTRYGRKGDRTAFSDGFSLLLIGQGSLDDLNRRMPQPLPMRRFRPNLVVSGAGPYAEDRWRRIRIGDLEMRVVKPCSRCIITTVDPDRGEYTGKEPLKTLAGYRRKGNRVYFGQNLIHQSGGVLAVGREVEVIEAVSEGNDTLEDQVP